MFGRMGNIMNGNKLPDVPDNFDNNQTCSNNTSPFYPNGGGSKGSFVLYLEPLLNTYYKSYQNVMTLNCLPPGPLQDMVVMIDMPKLSPFQSAAAYASPFYSGNNCVYVLLRYPKSNIGGVGSGAFKNADAFMGVDDIPAVFSYLQMNGYSVDTSLTKMLYQSRVEVGGLSERRLSGDRKMIAMVNII
jgi:hypothetical protein